MIEGLLKKLKKVFKVSPDMASGSSEDVRVFYNNNTDKFIQVYGDIIQAFRTKDVKDYLDYTIRSAELSDGQKILDAGCGIGGPASYFASKLQSDIIGITISDYQVRKSKGIIEKTTLKGTVEIKLGDYHQIDKLFGENVFDRVLFLESFGHSSHQEMLIEKAFHVLKPGGILYIKDLFKREHPNEADGEKIDNIVKAINQTYVYNIPDFTEVMKVIRRLNFILLFVKTPEVSSETFEHLTISNDFQNLFDIGKIISWDNYVFPIDFYEIKVMKPPFDISKEKHLYFLNRPSASP
jgi:ubiquinone/menaquinone biosynthesis C-methylase UbiE